MQAQGPIRRRATCIHRARGGGEPHPGGGAQAVKDSRQRGAAASTAERGLGQSRTLRRILAGVGRSWLSSPVCPWQKQEKSITAKCNMGRSIPAQFQLKMGWKIHSIPSSAQCSSLTLNYPHAHPTLNLLPNTVKNKQQTRWMAFHDNPRGD